MLILQSLYNLSDEQVESQVGDRLSFTRFLTSGIEDCIPDGTTLWLFREKLAKAGVIKKLFDRFDQHLGAKGYIARGGQIVDATIVAVPRQRNTREENEAIKRAQPPEDWGTKTAKNRQKDKDARWTKKTVQRTSGEWDTPTISPTCRHAPPAERLRTVQSRHPP